MGFFSTVQLVFAANDSQGLRYGTTGTPEKFFTEWKETGDHSAEVPCSTVRWLRMCRPTSNGWSAVATHPARAVDG